MSRYIDADLLIRYGKRGTLVYWEDIEDAPSIDIPAWIPCSERLPNENGTYLVTYEWIGKTGTKYIEIEGIDFEHGRWNCHDYEKVTAWMPLPKPWKGVDDAKEGIQLAERQESRI